MGSITPKPLKKQIGIRDNEPSNKEDWIVQELYSLFEMKDIAMLLLKYGESVYSFNFKMANNVQTKLTMKSFSNVDVVTT